VHYVGVSCGVDVLLQDEYSHTEKHMRGQRMRHKLEIASREGRAFIWLLFAQVNMLGKSREQEQRGLEEGFRIRRCSSGLVEGNEGL